MPTTELEVTILTQRIRELEADKAKLRNLLKRVEWKGSPITFFGTARPNGVHGTCPACGWPKPEGHTSDCPIAAALRDTE